jgi:steroid delta-isomerase-like uncharacterized protein
MTATATDTRRLAQSYGDAWNAHDIDAILSMHAEGMVFHLHLPGYEEVTGEANLRAHFGLFFELWPDLAFRSERLSACEGLFVNEMTMIGTLTQPMPAGWGMIEPNGKQVCFDAVDVVPIRDGKVARKDTYLDAASLLHQLAGLG